MIDPDKVTSESPSAAPKLVIVLCPLLLLNGAIFTLLRLQITWLSCAQRHSLGIVKSK